MVIQEYCFSVMWVGTLGSASELLPAPPRTLAGLCSKASVPNQNLLPQGPLSVTRTRLIPFIPRLDVVSIFHSVICSKKIHWPPRLNLLLSILVILRSSFPPQFRSFCVHGRYWIGIMAMPLPGRQRMGGRARLRSRT